MTDAFMHQHRTLVGPWRLFRARSVLPTHLSAIIGSSARPNELRARKIAGVSRTWMPPCSCIDGPFRRHFTGAKGKRSFRTVWLHLAPFRTSAGRSQISNWSVGYPDWSDWSLGRSLIVGFARLPGGRVKYANETQLRWPGQWPSTCKHHPGQWPSTCKNHLIGKELPLLQSRESHRREAAVSCSLYY